MNEQPAVMVRGMTKSYGKVRALRGLDLEVRRGEVFGFLGSNGAGKTTTIRCLLDTIRPDGGTARVLGLDPQREAVQVHARTGYLPGELHLDDNMTGEGQLRYFNALRGGRAPWARIRELSEVLDLDLKRPIKNLSRGNKQKVGIIRDGVLVEVAAPAALRARALHRVVVRLTEPASAPAEVEGVRLISQDADRVMTLEVLGDVAPFLRALAPYPVRDLETARPSLEDVFLAFFGDASDPSAITTPWGFLQYYFFSMVPVVAGIFALGAGSGLLAKDEEHGRLDLILAHPVGRTAFFFGRVLALAVGAPAVVFIGWAGCAILLQASAMGIGAGELALAFLPVFGQIWIYAASALLLSLLLPARRYASMVTGILLAASYILSSLGQLNPSLEAIASRMAKMRLPWIDVYFGKREPDVHLSLQEVTMIKDLIAKSRSYRRFDQSVPVPMETLKLLVGLARLSPSASNKQPLKYKLVNDPETNAKVFSCLAWAGYLTDWKGPAEGERPAAYIIILRDNELSSNSATDEGIVAQSMMLGAVNEGYGGCILGAISRPKLRELLEIPERYEIQLVLALGQPAETVVIDPVGEEGDIKYWRDDRDIHHVPKRSLDELILA